LELSSLTIEENKGGKAQRATTLYLNGLDLFLEAKVKGVAAPPQQPKKKKKKPHVRMIKGGGLS